MCIVAEMGGRYSANWLSEGRRGCALWAWFMKAGAEEEGGVERCTGVLVGGKGRV